MINCMSSESNQHEAHNSLVTHTARPGRECKRSQAQIRHHKTGGTARGNKSQTPPRVASATLGRDTRAAQHSTGHEKKGRQQQRRSLFAFGASQRAAQSGRTGAQSETNKHSPSEPHCSDWSRQLRATTRDKPLQLPANSACASRRCLEVWVRQRLARRDAVLGLPPEHARHQVV